MKIPSVVSAFIIGGVGMWLFLWNIIDFLTTGLDTGVWDFLIIQNGMVSITIGFFMVAGGVILGLYSIK